MVAPRMAALEAAMSVKSFPVIPSRTSLHSYQHIEMTSSMLILHGDLLRCDEGQGLGVVKRESG